MKRREFKPILNWIGVIFTIMAVAVGSYWLSQKQQKSDKFAGIREAVTIGVEQSALLTLFMIAEDQGFFSQQGLDVKIKYYTTGKLTLNGMFAGEVDMATPAETPVVFSSFERRDFSIVATIGSSDRDMAIVARKDKGIRKPGDLKGKHITTHKGSAAHFFLHSFLINNGLSEDDIKLSFRPADEFVPALAKGEADALCSVREPRVSQAKRLLEDNIVVFQEPGLYLKTYNLVAFNSFIKDKPQTVKSLLQALIKAEEFTKKYPEQAQRIVSKKLDVKESQIAILWPDLNFEVSLEQFLLAALENEARWAIKNKLTDKTEVPNYLDFIYMDGLKAVKPEAVTIIR